MILSLLKYFAKYPQKAGVLSMFANGESILPDYVGLITYIKNLPDPLIPELESYVFGQSHDTVKKRVDTIAGTYLFVDFGEFTSHRDARNSITDTQKLAVTVATKISDTADMVEEAIASNITLIVLSRLRRHLISDAASGDITWMEAMSSNHDIIPFVSPEFKSIGWTIMFDISASDIFGMKPLIQSFQED